MRNAIASRAVTGIVASVNMEHLLCPLRNGKASWVVFTAPARPCTFTRPESHVSPAEWAADPVPNPTVELAPSPQGGNLGRLYLKDPSIVAAASRHFNIKG
jgi:hypothetical protein